MEDSQSIQRATLETRPRVCVTGQSFAKEVRCVADGSNQLSPQKPGIETGIPRKTLWKTLLSYDLDTCEFHG